MNNQTLDGGGNPEWNGIIRMEESEGGMRNV